MPGKVVKVFVKLGDEVKEGQGLVVVEAMKMENELKSPKAGKVVEVFAKEGSAVENERQARSWWSRHMADERRRWLEQIWAKARAKSPERKDDFRTTSGIELDPVYAPPQPRRSTICAELGFPGEYPFTRGVQPTMYRGRSWTMRQYAGFGSAEESNAALPLSAQVRADRALGRVRSPDADGPRRGPPAGARRGGQGRRVASARCATWRCCSTASRSARSRRR